MDSQTPDFYHTLASRDPTADGAFIYAVRTTGVYCRPSCAARTPRPENIFYYPTPEAAEAAGFRPCKRCRPHKSDRNAALVATACRLIETAETPPDLATLAAAAKLSPAHFHRLFKTTTGITPKSYAAANRAQRTKTALKTAKTVTAAIYESGHTTPSRFHATTTATLGMTPTAFRHGAAQQNIAFAIAPCALGLILAARTEKGFCAIFLGDDQAALEANLKTSFPKATLTRADPTCLAAVLTAIAAPQRANTLPLDIAGTAFQRRVWQALTEIPPGQTASYAQIAETIGAKTAIRAVAAACAANKLAVAIPCHRAVRADGGLAGYRWGIARKKKMLDAEQNA